MSFLIYDGIVIAVLVLFACLGWRKGLLLSLCGLAAAVVAFLGAGFLADTLDGPVAEAMVPKLQTAIEERITSSGSVGAAVDALQKDGGLFAWAADAVEDMLKNTNVVPSVSDIASTAARYVAQRIAHSVIFGVSFLALYILLIVLLHALNLVTRLPGLNFCNDVGGCAIGLIKGGIIVFVAVAVVMSTSLRPDAQTLERSYLFKFFVKHNPILSLLGG